MIPQRLHAALAPFATGIQDGVSGFTFFDFITHALFDAVKRPLDVYKPHPDTWKLMMLTAMARIFHGIHRRKNTSAHAPEDVRWRERPPKAY